MRCVHLLAAHAQLNPIAVAITVVVVIVCCGAAPAGHVCGCSLLLVPPAPKQSETTIKLIYVSGQICAAILRLIWQSAVCRFVARSDFPSERGRGGGATCGSESVAGGSFWPIAQSRPVVSTRKGAIRFSECLLFSARQKVYDLLMSRLGKQRQLRFGQLRRLGQLIRNLAHILFILLNKFYVMFMGSTCIYCCCCCGRRAR